MLEEQPVQEKGHARACFVTGFIVESRVLLVCVFQSNMHSWSCLDRDLVKIVINN